MLFRKRVSLQGVSHVRRRAYDEMVASNAPPNALHGAQSHHQSMPLAFGAPISNVNHAYRLVSASPRTAMPTIDCRWKRGQTVRFSSCVSSTKQKGLNAQAGAASMRSADTGVTDLTSKQRDVPTSLCQSRNLLKRLGDGTTAKQQCVRTERPLQAARHDQEAPRPRTNHVNKSAEQVSTANALTAGSTDTFDADFEEGKRVPSAGHIGIEATSIRDIKTVTTPDPDCIPKSMNESTSKSELDNSDFEETGEEAGESHTPLEFQIPKDLLRAAMAAPENTKASFWSSNLYRGPEDSRVLVHYCKTKKVAERVARRFEGEKVVGFDIEWRPFSFGSSIKKNVSLIQLACENRIALFHLALFSESTARELLPPTLKAILESPEIYKVGVAVKGDFSRIIKYLGIEPQGVFELSRLHNVVQFSKTDPGKVTNKLVGLAAQVQQHLQLPLYKGGPLKDDPEDLSNVRSSDWSSPLNMQQIHYAAADAYAGFRLYDILEEKRKQLRPTPPRPQVCDYDAKPKSKSNDSKPIKKRQPAAKIENIANINVQEATALTEKEEKSEYDMEMDLQQSEDTDSYTTAQEDLLDSHQLEGEESEPSEETLESTDDNEESVSIEDLSQRRIGRFSLSRLKGSDHGYSTPRKARGDQEPCLSSEEDLVDISGAFEPAVLDQKEPPPRLSVDAKENDEFEDPELERDLQRLSIDSNGKLQVDSTGCGNIEQVAASERPASQFQANDGPGTTQAVMENQPHADISDGTIPALPPSSTSVDQEIPQQPTNTPEYDLATSWARNYLASTIPSPTSSAPSHIRATVPHLRAYNMWHYQELSLGEIAKHLRNPPLAESTVGSYVLQAIVLERMDYDEQAVKGVLLGMPDALRRGKWRSLADKVGAK